MLVKYDCFSCSTTQYNDNPPLKSENFMQWYFRCRCPNCNYANVVPVFKPMQMQLEFPPFKLN